MSFITFRTAGLAAGALILTAIGGGAFAQTGTSILTLGSFQGNYRDNGVQSFTYTFSSSMIVNSIGFVTGGYSLSSASYGIGSTFTSVNLGDLGAEVDGIRW